MARLVEESVLTALNAAALLLWLSVAPRAISKAVALLRLLLVEGRHLCALGGVGVP